MLRDEIDTQEFLNEIDTQEELSFYKVKIVDITMFSYRTKLDQIKGGLSDALEKTYGEYKLKPEYYTDYSYKPIDKKVYKSSKSPTEEAKIINEDISVGKKTPFYKETCLEMFFIVIGVDKKTSLIRELYYISGDGKFTFKFPLPINELSIEEIAEYFEKFMRMSDQNLINKWATLIDAKIKLDNKELDTKGTPPFIKFWEETITPENVGKLRDILKDVDNILNDINKFTNKKEVKKLFDTYAGQLSKINPKKKRHPDTQALYKYLLRQVYQPKTNREFLFNTALTVIQLQNCSRVFAKLPDELIMLILMGIAKNLSVAKNEAQDDIKAAFSSYRSRKKRRFANY